MRDRKEFLSRRPVIAGLAAITAAALGGIVYDLVVPKYTRATGPYADLIDLTADPDSARTIGMRLKLQAVGGEPERAILARELRARAKAGVFPKILAEDIAKNAVSEVDGWVMPQALVEICWLAAE